MKYPSKAYWSVRPKDEHNCLWIYNDGKLVAKIPREDWIHLIAALTSEMKDDGTYQKRKD